MPTKKKEVKKPVLQTKKVAKPQTDPKMRAAQLAIDQIHERFGTGAIIKMGESQHAKVETVSTGSISLDIALGGGIPRGRIIEIYGPEASGKTTLAQHIVAEIQKKGGTAAFVDAEHALDPVYARNLGVKVDDLLLSQPDTGEQALDIVETLVNSNAIDVIVVDSVAALTPRAEIEGDMGDSHMGLQARLMSQALRKLTGSISKSNTIVIFINQIRMKIGVMFGNPETTTGGNALKFYSSVRIEIRRRGQLKQGEKIIGNRVKAKVVKNKVAAPFRTTEFDIMFSQGISREGDVLDTAVEHGVVEKLGSWFQFGAEKLGQGREAAKQFLKEHAKVMRDVERQTWVAVREAEAQSKRAAAPEASVK